MAGRRKRTASACLERTQAEIPVRKSARRALVQREKDNSHGAPDNFPWRRLPYDLQERIMSNLTVRETATFTSAVRSRNARAIHHAMMQKRHEGLREVLRKHLGEEAALYMPPLDMADPGDVYVDSQVPPHLHLRPHPTPYKRGTITVVGYIGPGSWIAQDVKYDGWYQGYFTRAGLEGWGRWDGLELDGGSRSFEGKWRAGKREWGRFSVAGTVWTGAFKKDRPHGTTLCEDAKGSVYDYVFVEGKCSERRFAGLNL